MRQHRGRGVLATLLALLLCAACGHAVVGDTLLHVSFDDTVAMQDNSHHQHHGYLRGLPDGYSGKGMFFDTTKLYIEFPDAPKMELGFGQFTLELYVKPTTLGSDMTLLSKADSWELRIDSTGTVTFEYVNASGTTSTLTTSGTVYTDVWNHIEVTRDGGILSIDIDDVQQATGTISGNIADSEASLYISATNDATNGITNRLLGYLDEIKLFRPIAIEKKCIACLGAQSSGLVLAIKQDGTLWEWGNVEYRESVVSPYLNPHQLTDSWPYSIWEKICGFAHMHFKIFGLRSKVLEHNKTVYSWGYNYENSLGLGSEELNQTWIFPPEPIIHGASGTERFYNIGVGTAHYPGGFAFSQNGAFAWGDGPGDLYPMDPEESFLTPTQFLSTDSFDLEVWGAHGCVLADLGHTEPLLVWGPGTGVYGYLEYNYSYTPIESLVNENWIDISAGLFSVHAIKADGTLWAWGSDIYIGNSEREDSCIPVQIGTDNDWVWIASEEDTSGPGCYAIKSDGTLWAWGVTNPGNGSAVTYSVPTQIGYGTNWVGVFAGDGFACGLRANEDGCLTLWSWGYNAKGQLGLGITDSVVYTPTQVGTDTDWGLPVSKFIGFDTLDGLSPATGTTLTTTPTFSWNAMEGATRYELFVYSENPQQELLHVREYASNSYTVTEALPDANAKWTVRAGTGEGWYEWSTPIEVVVGNGSATASTITASTLFAGTNCTVNAGTAKTALYSTDFTTNDIWTAVTPQTDQSIEFLSGGLTIRSGSGGYDWSSEAALSIPYVEIALANDDFDLVLHSYTYNLPNNGGHGLMYGLAGTQVTMFYRRAYSGTFRLYNPSYAEGSYVGSSTAVTVSSSGGFYLRLERTDSTFNYYYKALDTDSWTLYATQTLSGFTDDTYPLRLFGFDNSFDIGYDSLEALDGLWFNEAVVTTDTLDAGYGCAFDWDTLAATANEEATATFEARESSDGTTWGEWGAVPASNTGLRYAQVRVTFGNGDGTEATLSDITVDSYVVE